MAAPAIYARLRGYSIALGLPLLLTGGLLAIGRPLSSANAALLYQLVVLGVAILAGLIPSIVAAVASMLAFHYFFVPAYFSFKLESGEDLVRLGVFLAVAISTSGLASHARARAEAERRRAAETASLYELSQVISAQVELAAILPTIADTTCQLLQVPWSAIRLAGPDGTLHEHSSAGAQRPTDTLYDASLRDTQMKLGVLQIAYPSDKATLSAHERKLLDTLAAQASLAIIRANLVQQVAHTQALSQSDQLKSALIASVSHDLRTPLATIKGAASTLQSHTIVLPHATQCHLAKSIEREADQLDRTIQNLLDMSHLEAGALQMLGGWHDVAELIGAVLQRLAPALHRREVILRVEPDLPCIWANGVLIEHVLVNLLENAAKYAPVDSPICIDAALETTDATNLVVVVRDHGPGIPLGEIERIFEKFYRGANAVAFARGSGLGLTICRGIVNFHGGTIRADNCADGGAAFTITLPLAHPSSQAEAAKANEEKYG